MRVASLLLIYNGVDISEDIASMVVGFSYTDYSDGKADSILVEVEDTKQLWKNSWFPSKGAKLRPVIVCENCYKTGDILMLETGSFEIDGVTASGPPEVVKMKGVSSPITKSIRRQKRTKAWESTTLEGIARELVGNHGLSLFYSADTLSFDRLDQRDESDLSFLHRLCRENGLQLKVSNEKVILFAGKNIEAAESSYEIDKSDPDLLTYSLDTKSHDIYSSCTVKYWDAKQKSESIHTFTPPDSLIVGHVLQINKRVESLSEAQRRAVSELRRKNQNETKISLSFVGNPNLRSGLNIDLTGFGAFSGKYFIDEARHQQSIGSGYTTNIDAHKVLEY